MKAWPTFAITLFLSACVSGAGALDSTDDSTGDDDDSVASPPEELVLFDAHIHLLPGEDPEDLVDLVAGAGVEGMAVLGMDDARPLQAAHPDFVRAFAFIPRGDDGALRLDAGTVPRLEDFLDGGAAGIGELSVRHFATGPNDEPDDLPADHPVLMDVYALAGDHGVPVNIHFDYRDGPGEMDSFEDALDAHPDATFVWAHAGDAQPGPVGDLLDAHPNLWADISCRNPHYPRWTSTGQSEELQRITDEDGRLKDEWGALFEDFADRVVWGSDVGPDGRDAMLDDVVAYTLAALEELDPEIGHAIASDNARRLLGMD